MVVGKGAAYGGAEEQVKLMIENVGLPFLPTPMGNDTFLFLYSWMFLKITILKLISNNLRFGNKVCRITFSGISRISACEIPFINKVFINMYNEIYALV